MSSASGATDQRSNFNLFLASFLTLIAAGIGFAVRGGVLDDWGAQFGFTKSELGTITGGGLVGFGVTIIVCSFIADWIGYKTLMVFAFLLHTASAVVTLAATPVYAAAGKDATYWCLYIGMFMFALGNGLCETVINPLVATLYPKQKTHYLNILHAGWPGGLIIGGLIGYAFVGKAAAVMQLRWEIPLGLFLVPTLMYGLMCLKEKFPQSEAREAGVDVGTMLAQFASPILLFLLFIHAMVGYVELGTDSWITNIMKNVIEGQEMLLFIYTSGLMFVLRFFAGPIVERINPVGLLLASALLGCLGLFMLGSGTSGWSIFIAASIYGVGKTFLWPTMLGVVGERFPKGGALTMGTMGGIGMLSAGLLGGPGIGYKQDYFASENLKQASAPAYERYKSGDQNGFLMFPKISGLDGRKVSIVADEGKELAATAELLAKQQGNEKLKEDTAALQTWWQDAQTHKAEDGPMVSAAGIYGGRMALKWTAAVPAAMAVGYLLLLLYFASQGGYQQAVLHGEKPDGERYTGGVQGPVE